MKHEGRGVIRVGDLTTHGGKVISASSGTVVMGKLAALERDNTYCPRCRGEFPILTDGVGAKHKGQPYAYHNDRTACGAKLISSLENSGTTAQQREGASRGEPIHSADSRHRNLDDRKHTNDAWVEFKLMKEDGDALSGTRYFLVDSAGEHYVGVLGPDGSSRLIGIAPGTCKVSFPDLGISGEAETNN